MLASGAKLRDNEAGFAAIVIAIVLILVLSLMTVGFADLMRHEEKSALDRHLSDQAYYAAESGVNDASKAVNAGYTLAKTTCDTSGVVTAGPGSQGSSFLLNGSSAGRVGTDPNIGYTCLLMDPTPNNLNFDAIGNTQEKTTEVSGVDSAGNPVAISSLVISWEASNTATHPNYAGAAHTFPPYNPYWQNKTGVLRVGLTPLLDGHINRDDLINRTFTGFLYPNGGGSVATTLGDYSQTSYSAVDKNGVITDGNCNDNSKPRRCNVRITNLGAANFLLDLRSIYDPLTVTVTAYDAGGNVLPIANGQVLVDSTGKAQDVLRRIQVRIPVKNNYDVPDFALSAMAGICKRLQLTPDTTFNSYGCSFNP